MTNRTESYYCAAVVAVSLAVFLLLAGLSHLDDNSLVGWQPMLDGGRAFGLLPAMLAGGLLAWAGSRYNLERPPVLFAAAFIISSTMWGVPEVIVDASRYFTQARHMELFGPVYFFKEWGGDIQAWTDLPLVPFLYGIVFKIFGDARASVQALVTAMFAATVWLTCKVGAELWDEQKGNIAGIVMLAMPYAYSQVPLMLVDVPSMFLLMLSLYTFLLALRRRDMTGRIVAAASLSAAVLSKYSLWMFLSVLLVTLIVRVLQAGRKERSKLLFEGTMVYVLGAGLSLLFFLPKLRVVGEQMQLLFGYQRPGLGRWGESFTSTFMFQIHPFVTAAAIYSIYVAIKKRDLTYVIAAWLLALIVFLQIKRARYLLPAFPFIALMAGYGLCSLKSMRIVRSVALVAVAASVVVTLFAYRPFLNTISLRNLKDAGRFIDSMDVQTVEVRTLPQESTVNPAVAVPILDLFTHTDIIYDYEFVSHLSEEERATSSLRFTWEYKNPDYYRPRADVAPGVLAVISAEPVRDMEGYKLIRNFNISIGIYRFKTYVDVYELSD